MKKQSLPLIIALFIGILLSSWLQAGETSKPDSLKSSKTENIKAESKAVTTAVPAPAKRGEGSLATFRGEISGDRVEDSYRFFEIYKDSYGLINPRQELKARGVVGDKYSVTAKLDQVVNGIKVRYGHYFVSFKPDGLLDCVSGQIDTNARRVDTTPVISEEQARQIAADDTKKRGTTLEHAKTVELMIGRFDGTLRLVWDINVLRLDSILIDSDYFIDAKTGAILENATRMRD